MKKVLLASAACLLAAPAIAQQNCAPREAVVTSLQNNYGETRRSVSLTANGMVVETWASADTETWTFTYTRPDGLTCMLASGVGYEAVVEDLPPAGSDS